MASRWKLLPPAGGGVFAVGGLLSSIGFGAYLATSIIYFTRVVGLPVAAVGAAVTVANFAALAVSPVLGSLSDRFGAKRMTVVLGIVQAVLLTAVCFVDNVVSLSVVIVGLGLAEQGGNVARSALITEAFGTEGRMQLSAYLRSTFNFGFMLGTALSGLAITIDTAAAYVVIFVVYAAATLVASLLYLTVATVPVDTERGGSVSMLGFLRFTDHRYLVGALLSGSLGLTDVVLSVGMPLLIISATAAPPGLAGWLLGINGVLVILLQVPLTRRATELRHAVGMFRAGAAAGAFACILFGLTLRAESAWLAAGLLGLAVVALTASEMWGSTGGWLLRYELAPPGKQGLYGGVFAFGSSAGSVLGPILVTLVFLRNGIAGPFVVAGLFLVIAAVSAPLVRWVCSGTVPSQTLAEEPA